MVDVTVSAANITLEVDSDNLSPSIISIDNNTPELIEVSLQGLSGANNALWGSINGTLSDQTDLQTVLDGKVDENAPITGATKTKITYDAKGLVTAGADATTSDIAEGSNLYFTNGRAVTALTGQNVSLFTNDSGYITSSALSPYLLASTAASTYATIVHTHVSTDITDFNEAVEDIIGSKIIAGSNVTVSYNDTTGETTISSTGGGGSISDGDKGDITVSGSGASWTIDNGVVTYAKMQDVSATSRILGRITSGAGVVEELTATNVKTILALATTDLSDYTEATQDVVGGMVSGNTESLISVTYDDTSGKLNFAVTATLSSYTNDAGFITSSALSGYVPYTGATSNVALGVNGLSADNITSAIFSANSYFQYTLAEDVNDLNIEGHSVVIVTPETSGYYIHNVQQPLGNNDFLYVVNGSDEESFFISNEADSGSAENNFKLPADTNLLLPPRAGAFFIWDKDNAIWRMIDNVVTTEVKALTPSANQNDYDISSFLEGSGVVTQVNIAPSNSIKITGFDATNVADGKEIIITNTTDPLAASARIIIFERQSSSSAAANRISYPSVNMPLILLPDHSIRLRYNKTQERWILQDILSPTAFFDLYSDLFTNAVAPFSTNTGGTSAGISVSQFLTTDTTYKTQGTVNCTLGTNTNGRAYISTGITSLMFGYGSFLSLTRLGIAVLSDATNEFVVQAGFSDSNTTLGTDSATWVYERTSSTDWRTRTSNNGSATQNTITGFTVTVDTMPYLGTFVNGDATNVDFFYSTNGETWTFTTPHTTNIPSGAARTLGFQAGGHKTAGTTSRNVAVDSVAYKSISKRGQ